MPVQRVREVHYTPEDDVKTLVDTLPNRAQRSLDVEIFGLTDLDLIRAILAAATRGVKVRVMNDRSQASGPADKAALQLLVDDTTGNVAVKVVESTHGAIDHLKEITVDGVDGALADTSFVLYGSYNFSSGAEDQDNVAVLTNDPGEVNQAMTKFDADWIHNKQDPTWQPMPTKG